MAVQTNINGDTVNTEMKNLRGKKYATSGIRRKVVFDLRSRSRCSLGVGASGVRRVGRQGGGQRAQELSRNQRKLRAKERAYTIFCRLCLRTPCAVSVERFGKWLCRLGVRVEAI